LNDKVITAARERGLDVGVRKLDLAPRTCGDAAEAVGCAEGQIARSVVYVVDGEPVLFVVPGDDEPDPGLICDLLDAAEARLASPEEARAATGFPVGAVPPIAHDLRVVLDQGLMATGEIFAWGGDGRTLVQMDPHALAQKIGATVAPITKR
jgi:prolyl-tRNA editing enzyme YbaK/EbsC (Cys-tRNA(Pro) deacylase)